MKTAALEKVIDRRKLPFVAVDYRIFKYDLTPSEFTVYSVLLSFVNRETSECFPSRPTIAAMARVSVRTVDAALDQLEIKKLIEIDRRSHKNKVNTYTILDLSDNPEMVQNLHVSGAKSAPLDGAKSAPEPESIRTRINEQESPHTPATITNLEGSDPGSKAAQERGGDGEGKVVKPSKPRKLTPRKAEIRRELYEIVCKGSFGKPWQQINGSPFQGRANSIAQKIHEDMPDITADQLKAGYQYFAKCWPDLVKDPDRRMRDVKTILDYVGRAQDAKSDAPFKPYRIYGDDCPKCKGGLGHDGMIFIEGKGAHHCPACWVLTPEGQGNG